MPVPVEFYPDAQRLGYGQLSIWKYIEEEWDESWSRLCTFAADVGFTLIVLEGRRVWGTRHTRIDGDTEYLLSWADVDEDPMNLLAQAFQRVDLIVYLETERIMETKSWH